MSHIRCENERTYSWKRAQGVKDMSLDPTYAPPEKKIQPNMVAHPFAVPT